MTTCHHDQLAGRSRTTTTQEEAFLWDKKGDLGTAVTVCVCIPHVCCVVAEKEYNSITSAILCIFFHIMFKRVPLLFTFDAFSRKNETVGLKNESRAL